jgi:hypothetical protein
MATKVELKAIASCGQSDGYLKKWAEHQLQEMLDIENTLKQKGTLKNISRKIIKDYN